jgi:hypothetical protein
LTVNGPTSSRPAVERSFTSSRTKTCFIFANRQKDTLLMYFRAPGGDEITMKRLDKGAFMLPAKAESLDSTIGHRRPLRARGGDASCRTVRLLRKVAGNAPTPPQCPAMATRAARADSRRHSNHVASFCTASVRACRLASQAAHQRARCGSQVYPASIPRTENAYFAIEPL